MALTRETWIGMSGKTKRNTSNQSRATSSPPSLTLTLILLSLLSLSLIPQTAAYTPLSDTSLSHLFPPSSSINTDLDFHPTTGALLSPILIPRVPGTPGSEKVQRHFVDFFARELPEWTLEWQNSTSTTPATGDTRVEFRNLVFKRDPPWLGGGGDDEGKGKDKFVKRLTLAAHYDSLYRPEGFIGAIDSAAPCAMLMAVARNVDRALSARWEGMVREREEDGDGLEDFDDDDSDGEDHGVQIVFLDGEEAWVKWTDTDSLYGSRALAEEWEGKRVGGGDVGVSGKQKTELDSISLFVLLDLLGGAEPRVPSFFGDTHWAYQHLAKAEARLRKMGSLESKPKKPFLQEGRKTANQFTGGYVLDDHVPFLQRGVPVLHVIPLPFPEVWHTMEDDGEHLDIATVGDWAKIVSAFVAEWMDVEGSVPLPLPEDREKKDWREKEEL